MTQRLGRSWGRRGGRRRTAGDPGWGQHSGGGGSGGHLPPLGGPQHHSGARRASLAVIRAVCSWTGAEGGGGGGGTGQERRPPSGSGLLLPHAGSRRDSGQRSQLPASHPLPAVDRRSIAVLPRKRRPWMLPPLLPPPFALKTGGERRLCLCPVLPRRDDAPARSRSACGAPLPRRARGGPDTPTSSSPARSSGRAWHRLRYLEMSLESSRGGYWGDWGVSPQERTGWMALAERWGRANLPHATQHHVSHGFYCFWE